MHKFPALGLGDKVGNHFQLGNSRQNRIVGKMTGKPGRISSKCCWMQLFHLLSSFVQLVNDVKSLQ